MRSNRGSRTVPTSVGGRNGRTRGAAVSFPARDFIDTIAHRAPQILFPLALPHQTEPRQFIDGGDTIVVIGREEATVKRTGKQYSQDWVHVLRYRDGKMVAFQSYDDTAAIAAAFS